MIFSETKYIIKLPDIKSIHEVLDAIHNNTTSVLIQEENIKYEANFIQLEIKVFIPHQVAGDSIVRMFPSLEKVLFPLSWKEKNKQ